jgi:hypothetical protein
MGRYLQNISGHSYDKKSESGALTSKIKPETLESILN